MALRFFRLARSFNGVTRLAVVAPHTRWASDGAGITTGDARDAGLIAMAALTLRVICAVFVELEGQASAHIGNALVSGNIVAAAVTGFAFGGKGGADFRQTVPAIALVRRQAWVAGISNRNEWLAIGAVSEGVVEAVTIFAIRIAIAAGLTGLGAKAAAVVDAVQAVGALAIC